MGLFCFLPKYYVSDRILRNRTLKPSGSATEAQVLV